MAYDWDNIVKEFEGKVDISDCQANDIPENVGINTIRFDIRNSSKECKAGAFIRHLRNAFAHYRIVREGNNYVLTDQNSRGTLTMRGVINADLLKDFCLRIFSQRDKIIDEYNNAINSI